MIQEALNRRAGRITRFRRLLYQPRSASKVNYVAAAMLAAFQMPFSLGWQTNDNSNRPVGEHCCYGLGSLCSDLPHPSAKIRASERFEMLSPQLRLNFPAMVPEAKIMHAQRFQPFLRSSNSPERDSVG